MDKVKLCLIGDSNLCQYAFPEKETTRAFLGVKEVHIVRTTVFTAFRNSFNEIADANCVVISALLNHVSDLERRWTDVQIDEEKANEITETLASTAKLINEYASEHPRSRVLVIPPIYRSAPKWLQDNMTLIMETFPNLLGPEVIYLNPFNVNDDELKSDGVHLRERTIQRLKEYVRENILVNLASQNNRKRQRTQEPNDDLDDLDENLTERQLLLRNSRILDTISAKLSKTDETMAKMDKRIDNNFSNYLIQSARTNERLDAMENKSRRNLLILRLVKLDTNGKLPDPIRERADYITSYISLEVNKMAPIYKQSAIIKSIFLIPTGGDRNYLQDLRLTCGSIEDAVEIRQRILKAKEAGNMVWNEVEVSNDPVKSTRVRISIMQAIARQINRVGDQEAVVTKFIDSPTLIIRNSGRVIKNLSYVDSILQYGEKLSPEDIEKGMKIAGRSYQGQMENNFLILRDTDKPPVIPTPRGTFIPPTRGTTPRGRGRGRGSWRGRTQMIQSTRTESGNQQNTTTWANIVTGANATPIMQPISQGQIQAQATSQQLNTNMNAGTNYYMVPQVQGQPQTQYIQQQGQQILAGQGIQQPSQQNNIQYIPQGNPTIQTPQQPQTSQRYSYTTG